MGARDWSFACPDWWERLQEGRSLVPELPLFAGINRRPAPGDAAVAVFNRLRLADVPGTPTMAEAGGDWFRDIVRALFGSLDPAARRRMIKEVFALVPKKNSKTGNGALLMLTALLLNERPLAPMILTAPVQDTTDLAFSAIAGAIELDPVLKAKLHVRDHLKTIVHRQTKAFLEVMTFDPKVVTGRKVAAALVDEPHLLGKMPRAGKAMLQLRGGMQPFPESFLMQITTQSDDAPAGSFKDDLDKARAIRDGTRVGSMLPVLYELPADIQASEDKRWRDRKLWGYVNPNAGKSISLVDLEAAFMDEELKGDMQARLWASQHLNVQMGISSGAGHWAGAGFWERNANPELTLEEVIARSDVLTIGVDGGGLDDLLGLCVLGRENGSGKWLHWGRAWAHPVVLERRLANESIFRDFEKAGDLVLVKEVGDDVRQLGDVIEQCEESGLLDRMGVDVAGIGAVVDEAERRGLEHDRIIAIPQGWKLTGAIKTVERKLAGMELQHGGRPMMAWCVGNARAEPRGNATMITKQISGAAKIDPLMALFDAAALMAMNPEPRKHLHQALFF